MNTTIEKELLLEFFLTFSKFEFALKEAGYHGAGEDAGYNGADKDAKPEWGKFAKEISGHPTLNSDKRQVYEKACSYYLGNIPKKQVVRSGKIEWAEGGAIGGCEVEQILVLVRRVRNNLFHGGKYNDSPDGKQRNETLLKHGIEILNTVLECSEKVQRAYDQARI